MFISTYPLSMLRPRLAFQAMTAHATTTTATTRLVMAFWNVVHPPILLQRGPSQQWRSPPSPTRKRQWVLDWTPPAATTTSPLLMTKHMEALNVLALRSASSQGGWHDQHSKAPKMKKEWLIWNYNNNGTKQVSLLLPRRQKSLNQIG